MARICQQLEGIPLALELAAARTTFLALPEMADLLGDRFGVLVGGSSTAPSRHRTLRAAVDWTYEGLSPQERLLFRRLAVFSGGFTLDAAIRVCADEKVEADHIMDLIGSLVNKSLVSADRHGARTRYRILETLRQYGVERLAARHEEDAARSRHLEWVVAFVEECEPRLWGADAEAALNELDDEFDNVRDGLRRAHHSGQAEVTLRVVATLVKFWRLRGYFVEARNWLEVALAACPDASPVRGKALVGLASLVLSQAEYDAADRWLAEAVRTSETVGDEVGLAEALLLMGAREQLRGDLHAAGRLYDRSLAAWRRTGRLRGPSLSVDALLHNMGEIAYERGNLELAAERFRESIDASGELGVTVPLIHPLTGLGHIARDRGDLRGARSLYDEALEVARRFGYRRGEAGSLQYLARVALAVGDKTEAGRLYREAMEVWSAISDRLGVTWCLEGLAAVDVASGCLERAAALLGAAENAREEIGSPLAPSERSDLEPVVGAVRAGLAERVLRAAWERGRSAPPEALVRWALGAEGPDDLPAPGMPAAVTGP